MSEAKTFPVPVLFLDVDGVLNQCGFSASPLHRDLLENLVSIVDATGCCIVLSSTWRKYPKAVELLKAALQDLGLTLYDSTPDLSSTRLPMGLYVGTERGHEIQAWMDEHGTPVKFAILDDGSDMAHLKPYLVKTHSYTGLTPELAGRVIKMLTDEP